MLTKTIASPSSLSDFAAEVRAGLVRPGQKELPSKYLYDDVGSALFEVITVLPEYGLTRADERLLRQHAEAMVRPLLPEPVRVAELGSGSGKKTRWILEALASRQRTAYFPIEISHTALEQCAKELGQIASVSIVGYEQPYLDGLLSVAAGRLPGERMLVLFLGSTIGNFDRFAAEEFLAEARRTLIPGDALLLGTDLEKPVPQLLNAYDDALGVTAAFNLNLLARINRELHADFDLAAFRHEIRYNPKERRVEMHLRSIESQCVSFPGRGFRVFFERDETIWTENSYKYRVEEVAAMGRRTGFRLEAQWVDEEWPFAQSLLIAE
jgi:L-histidine N-alpha-methyltransferase